MGGRGRGVHGFDLTFWIGVGGDIAGRGFRARNPPGIECLRDD